MTFPSVSTTSFNIDLDKEDISETEFLKNSIAHHVKYGSTSCNRDTLNHTYIIHNVHPNDTLQGLALRYACKIENIKKHNKLFTDDNNHLRSRLTILIPIEPDPMAVQSPINGAMENGTCTNGNKKLEAHPKSQSLDTVVARPRSAPMKSNSLATSQEEASTCNSTCASKNESLTDFLARIDSSIAKTKSQVGQASRLDEDGLLQRELNANKKKFNSPRISPEEGSVLTSSSSQSNLFPFDEPSRSTTSNGNTNKKVKSSIRRLEKKHEEIFEL